MVSSVSGSREDGYKIIKWLLVIISALLLKVSLTDISWAYVISMEDDRFDNRTVIVFPWLELSNNLGAMYIADKIPGRELEGLKSIVLSNKDVYTDLSYLEASSNAGSLILIGYEEVPGYCFNEPSLILINVENIYYTKHFTLNEYIFSQDKKEENQVIVSEPAGLFLMGLFSLFAGRFRKI